MSPHTMYLDATLARCDWLQSYDITRSEWISCGFNKKKTNQQPTMAIAGAIRVVSMILSMTGCVFLLVGRISTSSMLIDVLWFRKFLFGRCFSRTWIRSATADWLKGRAFCGFDVFRLLSFCFCFFVSPFDWLLSFARTPSNLPVPSGPGANWQAIRQRLRRIFFFFIASP